MSAKKTSIENEFVLDQSEVEAIDPGRDADTPAQKSAPVARNGKANQQDSIPVHFDPTQYLSNFDGRDYLEVKWRLLWLRSQHPDARITTEIVQHNEEGGFALFRAEVEVPNGGKATGWGSETVRD